MPAVGFLGRGGKNRVGPPLGSAGVSPTASTQTSLVVTYPGAIDVPPTIVDGTTPLSAQWHNYLAQLIEAEEAEIGPYPQGMVRRGTPITNFKDLLGWVNGAAVLAGVSIPSDSLAVPGSRGRAYGLQHAKVTHTGDQWALRNTITFTNDFWPQPAGRPALFFGHLLNEQGHNAAGIATNGPMIVMGRCIGQFGTSLLCEYSGCCDNNSSTWAPSGGSSYSALLTIVYMIGDEDG